MLLKFANARLGIATGDISKLASTSCSLSALSSPLFATLLSIAISEDVSLLEAISSLSNSLSDLLLMEECLLDLVLTVIGSLVGSCLLYTSRCV